MNTVKNRIDEIKSKGYHFDFSATFNHAFETFKKIAATAGLAFFIYGFFLSIIGYIYISTSAEWQQLIQNPDLLKTFKLTDLSTKALISYAVANVLFTALMVPLSAGIIQMCRNANAGSEFSVGTAFKYYTGHYFVDLFMVGVILGAFNISMAILFEYAQMNFLGLLISIVVTVLTFLTVPMVIFGNLRPIEALQASAIVVSKEFLMVFLLLIVGAIIAACGIIACCIGVLFTMPIYYAIQYSVYVHSVGIEENIETGDLS